MKNDDSHFLFLFQDDLKIDDDEFDDLQSLYQLFDLDKDGILNFKEYEKLLRCLGYRLNGKYYLYKVSFLRAYCVRKRKP